MKKALEDFHFPMMVDVISNSAQNPQAMKTYLIGVRLSFRS
jgi:hypothetical protein